MKHEFGTETERTNQNDLDSKLIEMTELDPNMKGFDEKNSYFRNYQSNDDISVKAFLKKTEPIREEDCKIIMDIMAGATGAKPAMWGERPQQLLLEKCTCSCIHSKHLAKND